MTIRIDHKDLLAIAFQEALNELADVTDKRPLDWLEELIDAASLVVSISDPNGLVDTLTDIYKPFVAASPNKKVEPQLPPFLSPGGGVVQTSATDIGEIASINALLSEGIRMAMIAGGRNPVFNAAACRTCVDVLNSNGIRRVDGLIFAACFEKLSPVQLKLINEFMAQWEVLQIQAAIAAQGGKGS